MGLKPVIVELHEGQNDLPQLYAPTVFVRGYVGILVKAATEPGQETAPGSRRDPEATTVAFDMDWKDAMQFAYQVIRYAKIGKRPLPEGITARDDLEQWKEPDA